MKEGRGDPERLSAERQRDRKGVGWGELKLSYQGEEERE
jgi:hypothetical protein